MPIAAVPGLVHNTDMSATHTIPLPSLIFGSSALGNLYEVFDQVTKQALVDEWFVRAPGTVCIDSAGKYGAGLALEELGNALRARGAGRKDFLFSNKLGWKRVPLTHDEPQFEKGVWKGLSYDAVQAISYEGIIECWHQGNELIGTPYRADLLSVHDPDEYLAEAPTPAERDARLADIRAAYRALGELREAGEATAVGVGAKDWRVAREIDNHVSLDWLMLAGSLTIYSHPEDLLAFVGDLASRSIAVINSAIFHSGFLVGGTHFDYRPVSRDRQPELFAWRDEFQSICRSYSVRPVDACVEFALAPAGIVAIALNTGKPSRVADNVRSVSARAPQPFWRDLKSAGLIGYTPSEIR